MKEFPYLLMLMKLWPGYWNEQIDQINKKVDEDNGIGRTQEIEYSVSFGGNQGTNSGRKVAVFIHHLPLDLGV